MFLLMSELQICERQAKKYPKDRPQSNLGVNQPAATALGFLTRASKFTALLSHVMMVLILTYQIFFPVIFNTTAQ